jgi:ankyrin repeat protein
VLHWAAVRHHKEIVALLLVHKADVNAKSKSGQTPLDWAESQGDNEDVAELLRQHGGHE